jgi:flagellar basal body-associated protein FliL
MSEEAEKPADAAAAPKKSKKGLVIGIVIALVTLVGGSVAGAVLGPKLLGGSAPEAEEGGAEEGHAKSQKSEKSEKSHKSQKSEKKSSHGEEGAEGPEKIINADIAPVVVDLRDAEGRIRHLKVGMTAELAEQVSAEDFKLVVPRGREAALTYLRSLTFEDVADPQHFIAIKDELSKRVTEAVGEDRVHRMMLTDFVLQ